MSAAHRQAHIESPVEQVWALVGDPRRHPEWFPRVLDVRGERFDVGDIYVQRTRGPFGTADETRMLIDRRTELREIHMTCQVTGMYSDWRFVEARGGTFVDVELGMQPKTVGVRIFDIAGGELYFRRWLARTLDALRDAAAR